HSLAGMEWQPVATAPFDRDLELAVIDYDGPHALVFPCRRNSEWLAEIRYSGTHLRTTDALASVEGPAFTSSLVCGAAPPQVFVLPQPKVCAALLASFRRAQPLVVCGSALCSNEQWSHPPCKWSHSPGEPLSGMIETIERKCNGPKGDFLRT